MKNNDVKSPPIFGRKKLISQLVQSVQERPISFVVGRPLMGKTTILKEVTRILEEEQDCLVGYHEIKGGEQSHILHAVSDLYA